MWVHTQMKSEVFIEYNMNVACVQIISVEKIMEQKWQLCLESERVVTS